MKPLVLKLTMVFALTAVSLAGQPGFANANARKVKPVLSQVDVEIKTIHTLIEKKRTEETDINDDISESQDAESRILQNGEKAADSYQSLLCAATLGGC